MTTSQRRSEPVLDVLFAGNLFCDLVFAGLPRMPEPGGEVFAQGFSVSAGGTANRSVAAARLGLRTGLASVVGTDLFGTHLVAVLGAEEGLDLRWLKRDATVRTPVTASLGNDGDRSFITFNELPEGRPDPLRGDLSITRVCHLPVDSPLPSWAPALRSRGTLLVGGVGWDGTERWSSDVLDRLAGVDVFCPNAVEAMRYTRADSPERAAKELAGHVGLVVVTLGAAGAVAVDGASGELVEAPAVPVRVVDPTGAGDVFVAALIFATVHGWQLPLRLRFATVCASLSVRSLGGASGAPSWPAVRAFLDEPPLARRPDPRDPALRDAIDALPSQPGRKERTP